MSRDNLPLLIESIKIEEGEVQNLAYHQKRCNQSRKILYGVTDTLALSPLIQAPKSALFRCRILYGQHLHSIEYIPYVPKEIQSIKIVSSNIDYGLKYANREGLNTLLYSYPDFDEILIEKEGYLSDTSIANIAFYDGSQWVTPKKPLLKGTVRAKLIDECFLKVANISKVDLSKYTHLALMNAMIGFKVLNINIIK